VTRRRTVLDFAKGRGPYVWITAYDYPTARLVDEAGVDGILVGDSLGMVVLGLPNTLGVTMADMVRHTEAVARARPRALVVADMPFMSYEPGPETALRNASRLVRAGADAVKLEGGAEYAHIVEKLVKAGIPVMGHIGLTPQRVLTLGGFRMVGKTEEQKKKILEDAKALRDAGVFSIVLEFVPASLAKEVTESVDVPTICIGSGPHCDGQILVLHDVIGLSEKAPSFAKRYADAATLIKDAVTKYAEEVRKGLFPSKEHYRD
jgi:3-methyl-2-oxobutanoate hydroxymethyltransferase